MKNVAANKMLLLTAIFFATISQSMGLPAWLERIASPILQCTQGMAETKDELQQQVFAPPSPSLANTATTINHGEGAEGGWVHELPVVGVPQEGAIETVNNGEDEFVIPGIVHEPQTPVHGTAMDNGWETAQGMQTPLRGTAIDNEEDILHDGLNPPPGTMTEIGWDADLARLTILVLGWLSVNARANAGCGGGHGRGDRDSRGRGRNTNGHASDRVPILDRIGRMMRRLAADFDNALLGALGMRGEDGDDDSVPDSAEGRIVRWQPFAIFWKATGMPNENPTQKYLGTDIEVAQQIVTAFRGVFPKKGFTKGFDHACAALLKCVGNDEAMAQGLFNAWAISADKIIPNETIRHKAARYAFDTSDESTRDFLMKDNLMDMTNLDHEEQAAALFIYLFKSVVSTLCSTLGLPDAVLAIIIDETLKAGLHGPGVSMWVTTALLSIAQRDTDLANNTALSKVDLCKAAAAKVTNFSDLENAASVTLSSFMGGYVKAVGGVPVDSE